MKRGFVLMCVCLIGVMVFGQDLKMGFVSQNNGDFAKTIANDKVQLVDVRTASEFADGHIPRAINIDVNGADFDKKVMQLDKRYPVAVYCRSGGRSKTAARKLAERGFNVFELDKGIMNWNGKIDK